MFEILNKSYQEKMGKEITIADLGKSTEHLNFFLTKSISQTLSTSHSNTIEDKSKKQLIQKLFAAAADG